MSSALLDQAVGFPVGITKSRFICVRICDFRTIRHIECRRWYVNIPGLSFCITDYTLSSGSQTAAATSLHHLPLQPASSSCVYQLCIPLACTTCVYHLRLPLVSNTCVCHLCLYYLCLLLASPCLQHCSAVHQTHPRKKILLDVV